MKAALVHCPFVNVLEIPPLAPALLKSCLGAGGIPARTYDFNLKFQKNLPEEIRTTLVTWFITPHFVLDSETFNIYQSFVADCADQVLEYDPTTIGISVFSHESQRFAEDLCYAIKIRSNRHILVGGSGISIRQNQYGKKWGELMIDSQLVDCALEGEGELVIVDLVANQKKGFVKTTQIDNEELADLPVPNFDDYQLNDYGPVEKLSLPITSSKGCVRSCSFCDVGAIWPKFRYRRGTNVAEEMIGIYRSYGIKNFTFTDSLINGGLKPFREMNDVLARDLPDTLHYSGQFICRDQQSMPEKDFELMKKGGCRLVGIGIESGSESVRNHMKKNFSNNDIDYTAEQCLKHNIKQIWNIIVGYPTETDDDWQQTLALVRKYQSQKDLIKIAPVGVFQLLQHTPITQKNSLESLEIEMHVVNGYSEYNWVSGLNPKNNLRQRVQRWFDLIELLESVDMLATNSRVKEKSIIIKQQLEFYESSDKTVFPILSNSQQNPTIIDIQ
jgi:radical SAM superfamily enzyme YgiQ (UPF0313 family)